MKVNLPSDFALAIQLYYGKIELGTQDVRKLFRCSTTAAVRLKKMVQEVMAQRNVVPWNATAVNTQLAYEVWGLDIKDLENRLAQLQKLKEAQSAATETA